RGSSPACAPGWAGDRPVVRPRLLAATRTARRGHGGVKAGPRLLAGLRTAGQAVHPFADLAKAGAELLAVLAEGAGVLSQVQGLLDELVCPGGLLGPGAGQVSHAVASFHRTTLPSPST